MLWVVEEIAEDAVKDDLCKKIKVSVEKEITLLFQVVTAAVPAVLPEHLSHTVIILP